MWWHNYNLWLRKPCMYPKFQMGNMLVTEILNHATHQMLEKHGSRGDITNNNIAETYAFCLYQLFPRLSMQTPTTVTWLWKCNLISPTKSQHYTEQTYCPGWRMFWKNSGVLRHESCLAKMLNCSKAYCFLVRMFYVLHLISLTT